MDDREEKQHFNMKEIIDNEKRKKKRKKGKQDREEIIDQFEIDVHDKRFSALFNSPDYILDPSDPQFKCVYLPMFLCIYLRVIFFFSIIAVYVILEAVICSH